ncbi:MAG: nucleotidyltransferase domain-containing protein [Candidatus Methanomethylicia archaeon]
MFKFGIEHLHSPYREVIDTLFKELLEYFGDKLISIIVFGSVARGEARKDSDVDLFLVIKDLPKSRFERQDIFMKIEDEITHILDDLRSKGYYIDFSPILKTPMEASKISPIYLDMVEDAIIVYDKNFMVNILNKLRNKLNELGAERVRMGKGWYWILKKNYKFGEVIEIE